MKSYGRKFNLGTESRNANCMGYTWFWRVLEPIAQPVLQRTYLLKAQRESYK